AEVVSSNIVGYEKVNIKNGFNAVGVQFFKVGGTAIDLQSVGVMDDNFTGPDLDTGLFTTELMVWDPATSGYAYYGWSGTLGTDVLDNSDLDNVWLDENLELPEGETTPAGAGFWINTSSSGNMTISGEVPADSTKEISLSTGFNMVANPYPVATPISGFGKLDSSYTGPDLDTGLFTTELMVWDPATSGYTYYGWSSSLGTDVLDNSDLDNVWLDENLELPTESIPCGGAVWINASNAGKITFTSPSAE
ncbi:MAG: hypothetical protein IKL85_06420, partial [Lentisphaeria bacterium]|nr:hypothetical protein [Lentisphaeria bacterium]